MSKELNGSFSSSNDPESDSTIFSFNKWNLEGGVSDIRIDGKQAKFGANQNIYGRFTFTSQRTRDLSFL